MMGKGRKKRKKIKLTTKRICTQAPISVALEPLPGTCRWQPDQQTLYSGSQGARRQRRTKSAESVFPNDGSNCIWYALEVNRV